MTAAWKRYYEGLHQVMQEVLDTQEENMMKAARICADVTEKGGLIYALGSWHSMLVAEEQFYRAASPANFVAICPPQINGTENMSALGRFESMYGFGDTLVDYWRIDPEKDCLIVISNSGNNIVTNDAAIRAKEKGIPTIALTSVEYGDTMVTKHKSGMKLKDICDVVLDNCCPLGDAVVELEGLPIKAGPASGIPMYFLMSALLVQMEELCLQDGVVPEVYYNGHVRNIKPEVKEKNPWLNVDSDEHNQALINKYFYRIKTL
ncbi:MAG: sugar isomerase domain-containing protein [Erysipelotrichaceae bacterium]|nr:sugar isomerase domain-containing protein [Erysipelotrichaceae bacterium]